MRQIHEGELRPLKDPNRQSGSVFFYYMLNSYRSFQKPDRKYFTVFLTVWVYEGARLEFLPLHGIIIVATFGPVPQIFWVFPVLGVLLLLLLVCCPPYKVSLPH